MAPKQVIPSYAAGNLDVPLTFPEDNTLSMMPAVSEVEIVKPPGVRTLREWGEQILAGGKHSGKSFSQALAVDASYAEFMKKKKIDCASPWALSFHNYVLAMEKSEQSRGPELRQRVLTPAMIQQAKQEWALHGAVATDWDVVDELKGMHGSEVPMGITSSASGSAPTKRMLPVNETSKKMSVDMQKETMDRVNQIQTQIAILQRELNLLLPEEDA